MAAHRQCSKPVIAFMFRSRKTPSPISIPGYMLMKTLQMVSLDDVTTMFAPSSHKCSGNETENS